MYDPMNQENNQNLNNQNADQNVSPVQESPVQHAGEHSDSQTAITAYLTSKKAGDTVTLEVYNGLSQQTFTAEVTLAESTGE